MQSKGVASATSADENLRKPIPPTEFIKKQPGNGDGSQKQEGLDPPHEEERAGLLIRKACDARFNEQCMPGQRTSCMPDENRKNDRAYLTRLVINGGLGVLQKISTYSTHHIRRGCDFSGQCRTDFRLYFVKTESPSGIKRRTRVYPCLPIPNIRKCSSALSP